MEERGKRPSPISDVELIAHSAVDPAVFGELFERHFEDVYRYLARRIGSERADDVASQTFVVAFERRDSFDPEAGQVSGWLLGIATHLLWNERRSEQRSLRLIAQIQSQTAPDLADSDLDHWRLDGVLANALLALDGDQRDVLLLTAWAELSYDEVAAALSIPVGTVRSRLSRAKAQLRTALNVTSMSDAAASAARSPEVS